MSDNLIKRLARWGADEGLQNHFIGSRSARRDCEEAAVALADAQATIARLEAALREIANMRDYQLPKAQDRARAALSPR